MILLILLFVLLGALFSFYLVSAFNEHVQKSSTYELHLVKARLTSLVARGKLDENSQLFIYYNSIICSLLELGPKVNVDNALRILLDSVKKSKDLDRSLEDAVRYMNGTVHGLAELQNSEVNDVIADYYAGSRDYILAHSNLKRLLYLSLVLIVGLMPSIKQVLSKHIRTIVDIVKFTNEEESIFRNFSSRIHGAVT